MAQKDVVNSLATKTMGYAMCPKGETNNLLDNPYISKIAFVTCMVSSEMKKQKKKKSSFFFLIFFQFSLQSLKSISFNLTFNQSIDISNKMAKTITFSFC